MKIIALALIIAGAIAASANTLVGQTFTATPAIEETKCQRFLFSNKCVTVETDRIHWTFTQAKLGFYVFGRTWATASHCTHVDATETKCLRSVSISTDPEWNRVFWGQAGTFLRLLGAAGTPGDGPYHFWGPLGVDITRREGEWHVGFIADAKNNRIAVIAFGYNCKCVRWLGTLDGSESGTSLKNPHDVAWDPVDTWTLTDDRVFIADTENDRIVVYQVSLNLTSWTMAKTYLNSFGSSGSGAGQLSSPRGLTVRSRIGTSPSGPPPLWADVYISDTDNHRVSVWLYDAGNSGTPGNASAAAQSPTIPGSELVGISQDYYGDVIAADRARNVLVKFGKFTGAPFTLLKTYGGTSFWSTGNFNFPSDAEVIYHYWQDGSGHLVQEALPYVQTVEQWTATSGGQLHHLGVDAEGLAVTPGQCDATFAFLFTGVGDYTVKVKNSAGTVIQSWTRLGVGSGTKSEYWNGQGQQPGTYSYVVDHRSGYGDETQWRTSNGPSFTQNCFGVTASAPATVTQGGTYGLNGSATHAADSWRWERNDGGGYSLWANGQSSSFEVPHDPGANYTINWAVTARRTSDGTWASGFASTHVDICMPGGGVECPLGPAPSQIARSSTALARTEPVTGRVRRNEHRGAGAWIGGRSSTGAVVLQLFGLTGAHQDERSTRPNFLGGDAETIQEVKDDRNKMVARVVFTRRALSTGQEAYRARYVATQATSSGQYLGLAVDPELGSHPGDEVLGFDAETGLVWVADPDSGVIGYVVTDVPSNARVIVRQFSTRSDAWRPDPLSDSAAYAELSANDAALTGKLGDVRFLISIGPLGRNPNVTDIGLLVLRASSLQSLREVAGSAPRSVLALFAADTVPLTAVTAITRFKLSQAPPDPMAPEGVTPISPALVPALSSGADSIPISAGDRVALREAVRRYGITALAFAVPEAAQANVTIRLYDPAGRLVRTLVDEGFSSGTYRAQWDLRDHRGKRVAPGVYIAIMEAQGFRGMTRLVVVP